MTEHRIYNKLTDPNLVKFSTIIAFTIALSALVIGYIIASVYGNTGYNLFDNVISDMGNSEHTPFPYMRTIANVGSGPFFIPLTLYIRKELKSQINNEQDKSTVLLNIGFIGMCMLFIAMMITGIITLDVHVQIHIFFALIAITGGLIASVSYGLIIIRYQTDIPRGIGIFILMILIIILIGILIGIPSVIFYEWVLLLYLYLWVALFAIFLLKSD